ncbi:MAG: hypothetical protein IKS16_06080 [Lachnospiraceae bacterium]|nr:hypothetical protein [Lachnospiraceae bacterium]
MARKNRIIFSSHDQSDKGIMALILGVISALSLAYASVVSYIHQGEVPDKFGGALFVTFVFAVAGLILGGVARNEADKLRTVPTVAIALNGLVILALGFFLWIGLN